MTPPTNSLSEETARELIGALNANAESSKMLIEQNQELIDTASTLADNIEELSTYLANTTTNGAS